MAPSPPFFFYSYIRPFSPAPPLRYGWTNQVSEASQLDYTSSSLLLPPPLSSLVSSLLAGATLIDCLASRHKWIKFDLLCVKLAH